MTKNYSIRTSLKIDNACAGRHLLRAKCQSSGGRECNPAYYGLSRNQIPANHIFQLRHGLGSTHWDFKRQGQLSIHFSTLLAIKRFTARRVGPHMAEPAYTLNRALDPDIDEIHHRFFHAIHI